MGSVVVALLLLASGAEPESVDQVVAVSDFAGEGLSGWQVQRFADETDYRVVEQAGCPALHAKARGTASGWYREVDVDLEATPVLEWSWLVEEPLVSPDPRSRAGDDYAARVYVVFPHRFAFWRTTTLNYVWADGNVEPGSHWPNPYTSNAHMLALRSGPAAGWVTEARDVRADYERLFGRPPPAGRMAVAIMTDADDTNSRAEAWYGDLRFRSGSPDAAVGGTGCVAQEPGGAASGQIR
ncbi:MAG: DUF3047 domain-containing protein [Gammaproteobacteria bacterium]|nr:DUF3047 domain-containing protein [Gammaproteobacteria bacterium]